MSYLNGTNIKFPKSKKCSRTKNLYSKSLIKFVEICKPTHPCFKTKEKRK